MNTKEILIRIWLALNGVKMPKPPPEPKKNLDQRYSYRIKKVTTYFGTSYMVEYSFIDDLWHTLTVPLDTDNMAYSCYYRPSTKTFMTEAEARDAALLHAKQLETKTSYIDLGKLP